MKLHIAAAAAAALSCAACANQAPMQPMGLGFHGQLGNETPAATGNGAKIASEVIPDAAAPALGLGQPSRGFTSRRSSRPQLSIARAVANDPKIVSHEIREGLERVRAEIDALFVGPLPPLQAPVEGSQPSPRGPFLANS